MLKSTCAIVVLSVTGNTFANVFIDDFETNPLRVELGDTVSTSADFYGGVFNQRTVSNIDRFPSDPGRVSVINIEVGLTTFNTSPGTPDPLYMIRYSNSISPVFFAPPAVQFGLTTNFGTDSPSNPETYLMTLTVSDSNGDSFVSIQNARPFDVVSFDLSTLDSVIDTSAVTSIEFVFDGAGFNSPDLAISPIVAVPTPGTLAGLGLVGIASATRRRRSV